MPKLTKALIENAQPKEDTYPIWDTEIVGFGCRIHPTGRKTFVYSYRTPEARTKLFTIGKLSDTLTVEQARKRARECAHDVFEGRDPQNEKKVRRVAPTLALVFDDYLKSDVFLDKADSTRLIDTGRINRHLRPLLGNVIADKLTTDEVKRAAKAITAGETAAKVKTGNTRGVALVKGGAGTAKKAVKLLGAICKWSTRDGTPAGVGVDWSDIKLVKDGERETIIQDATEYGRLFDVLDTMENERRIRKPVADAIRVIALTGARRGEVTGLRWSYVDLKNGRIILPPRAHKTGHGSGKPKVISLPATAQAIIARQPEGKPDEFVFKPAHGVGPLTVPSKLWHKVTKAAGLPGDLVLHSLRHSTGSLLAMAGASPVEIMKQLGHKQISTSMRYIHFAENAKSTLAERAAAVAVSGMKGNTETATVSTIGGRRVKA